MTPKETLSGHQEAFDRCVEGLQLVELKGFSVARAQFGDVYVYMSRQHAHGDGDHPERITNLRTGLDVSLPKRGNFAINISVVNPLHLPVLEKVVGESWAIDILTREYNCETEIRYAASGRLQSMKGEVYWPDVNAEQGGASTMIVNNRWVLAVPSYHGILEHIGGDGLGVALKEIHGLEPEMESQILKFAQTPDWAPILYDSLGVREEV